MWKIWYTKKSPFWAIQNGNKPSKIIFDEFAKTFEGGQNNILHLNFIDNLNAQFVGPKNTYKYFKLENEDGDIRYYFVNSIDKAQDNSYVYNVSLDIYATFTMPFIERNKEVNFFFNRTHVYDRWVGIVGDKELDEAPKALASVGAQKYFYPNTRDAEGKQFWYNNFFGISDVDTNCYRYFVFKDGPNGSYTIFPIINKTKAAKWYQKNYKKGRLKSTHEFKKGDRKWRSDERIYENTIDSNLNKIINNAYRNGDFVEYFYRPIYDNVGSSSLGAWRKIDTVWNTMPIDLNTSVSLEQQCPGFYATTTTITCMGRQIYYNWVDGQVAWEKDDTWENVKAQMLFTVEIYERIEENEIKPINIENSEQSLYEMITNPEWTNKFVGIFAGPNILAFDDGIFKIENVTGKNRVKFTLPPNGIEMTGFNVYRYIYREVDGINNIYYGNEYSLKYLNINYFNNNIFANHRKNSQNTILFAGKLLFCNGFTLISKNSDLIPLSQSLISYGGMLPTSKNEYLSMVNAQRNSMDTSYAIKRQEANINSTQGIANGMIEYATAGVKAGAQIATGDFGGAASSVIGGAKALAGGIYNVFNNERQLKNYRKTELAKFKDANNTLGNNISFSSLADASISAYMDSETGEQFEAVEAIILNSNTNIFINNYLYLYGYYYPHLNTFFRVLNNTRKFNYIELGETAFENNINAKFNFLNPAELELVKQQLKNGIRIWNQNNLDLPDDFNQKLPQIGGDFQNSPVRPPNNIIPQNEVIVDPSRVFYYKHETDEAVALTIFSDGYEVKSRGQTLSSRNGYDWTKYDLVIFDFPYSYWIEARFKYFTEHTDAFNRRWEVLIPQAHYTYFFPEMLPTNHTKAKILINKKQVFKYITDEEIHVHYDEEEYINTLTVNYGHHFTMRTIYNLDLVNLVQDIYIKDCSLITMNAGLPKNKMTLNIHYKGKKPEIKTTTNKIWVKFIDENNNYN